MYNKFVVFDVETPNKSNSRMSSIGISVIENGRITDKFYSLINPEQKFDTFNSKLTKISEETVKDEPKFPEVWNQIEGLMSDGILVAHNATFDLNVLKKCLQHYKIKWRSYTSYLCTVQIGRKIFPGMKHNLNVMCKHYNIQLDHHKASSDSHACAEILLHYLNDEELYFPRYIMCKSLID